MQKLVKNINQKHHCKIWIFKKFLSPSLCGLNSVTQCEPEDFSSLTIPLPNHGASMFFDRPFPEGCPSVFCLQTFVLPPPAFCLPKLPLSQHSKWHGSKKQM